MPGKYTKRELFEAYLRSYERKIRDVRDCIHEIYLDDLVMALEEDEKFCSERAVEYLQSKPALEQFDFFEEPQVWEPKRKDLKERILNSIYTFVTYETAETRILAKARFILECHAWRWVKQRNEKVWILPDDRKTKLPERAWKAWLRDYELKQKIQNEIENNCDL